MRAKQQVAHHKAQNGVAQKLQLLIVGAGVLLVCMRTVSQSLLEQPLVGEPIDQLSLEFFECSHTDPSLFYYADRSGPLPSDAGAGHLDELVQTFQGFLFLQIDYFQILTGLRFERTFEVDGLRKCLYRFGVSGRRLSRTRDAESHVEGGIVLSRRNRSEIGFL